MPLLGGIILILQIALSVHVIKTGRPWYWIMLIVFLPLIGILAYGIVELAPEYLGGYRGRRAASALGRALTPGRNYRRRRDAVDAAPTVQNMMALAGECQALGQFDEAVELYRRCLQGVHAEDTAILFGLAQAEFDAGDAAAAHATLETLNAIPHYQSADAHLLFARSLEAMGETAATLKEYESVIKYYPGPEALCRYALMLQRLGQREKAAEIFADVKKNLDRSPWHVRRLNREWYDIARHGGVRE